MGVLETGGITLPREMTNGIWKKAQDGSAVAALVGSEPQKFGETDIMTFDTDPKAEFVAEGGQKSSQDVGFGLRTVKPHKAQVTMRFSSEVKWSDEDYQLEVLQTLSDAAGIALGRALDLGSFHAINPLSGLGAASITDYLMQTANIVIAQPGNPDIDIESAAGLVIADHFTPTGVALDRSYAWTIATTRYNDGRKKFPDLGLGIGLTQFEGISASVSDTVSASREAASPTDVLGIVGDWSTFRWGVQRNIGVQMIEFGDPDGQGDLKRLNQIALRAEVVYGWAFMDKNAFAVIKAV